MPSISNTPPSPPSRPSRPMPRAFNSCHPAPRDRVVPCPQLPALFLILSLLQLPHCEQRLPLPCLPLFPAFFWRIQDPREAPISTSFTPAALVQLSSAGVKRIMPTAGQGHSFLPSSVPPQSLSHFPNLCTPWFLTANLKLVFPANCRSPPGLGLKWLSCAHLLS